MVKFNNYSELMEYIDAHDDKVETILDYEDFAVVKIDNQYFYYEVSENDADEFCEVEIIAKLKYDVIHDLKIPPETTGLTLSSLFDCFCCGEYVGDESISYLWFEETED